MRKLWNMGIVGRLAVIVVGFALVALVTFLIVEFLQFGGPQIGLHGAQGTTAWVVAVLLMVALLSSFASMRIGRHREEVSRAEWWSEWLQGLSTEMVGAVLTFFLLTVILSKAEQRDVAMLDLASELRTADDARSAEIVRELSDSGALYDNTLFRADLSGANLAGADLSDANLSQVRLDGANLDGADMRYANVSLGSMVGASLRGANLSSADLGEQPMNNCDFTNADLSGALLRGSELTGATLDGATFDETTILPDGTFWEPGTDMSRFTDPNHPDFESEW